MPRNVSGRCGAGVCRRGDRGSQSPQSPGYRWDQIANGFDYLDGHLAAVVRQIETRSPVKLAAIGIGHDVSQFYANATRISKVDDLGPALTAKLLTLLSD